MAKAAVKVLKDKKGNLKAEYPKLIKTGEHVVEGGKATAPKVLVNSAEEEADVRKKYKLDDEEKKPAGGWQS